MGTYNDFLKDEFGPGMGQDLATFTVGNVARAFGAGAAGVAPALSEPVAWGIRRKGARQPHMITLVEKVAKDDMARHDQTARLTDSTNPFELVSLCDHAAPNQTPAPAAQGLSDAEIQEIVERLYREKDIILDPFDARIFARAIIAASRTTPKEGA